MWYSAPDINQSQRGWWPGSECISFGELEFTSSRDTVSARKFIIAVSTHKPLVWALWIICQPPLSSVWGSGREWWRGRRKKNTAPGYIMEERNEIAEREMRTHTQRRKWDGNEPKHKTQPANKPALWVTRNTLGVGRLNKPARCNIE